MDILNGARNVAVFGGHFAATAGSPPSLDRLVSEVAPNAILNAGGRADEVRCFPGTREEVIEKVDMFMDGFRTGSKRMMWLSGPAGAGKSAICQTVAERRSNEQQTISFFFFRGDSTRSHSRPLVATLVYQLRRLYPAVDDPLSECLNTDPLICSASIEAQFRQLIVFPIQRIQQSTIIRRQIVIIIDGLDECDNEKDQDQILISLYTLAHAEYSPFLVLVSSRADSHLVRFFNRVGSTVESIFLNDDYKPQHDIRLFVVAEFTEIKRNHPLARTLDRSWPPKASIDSIVNKSSGHFIYAVTVMRYIQSSSASPKISLGTILEVPPTTDHNPLAPLDAVYSYIFSKAKNIQAVKLILFIRQLCASIVNPSAGQPGGLRTPDKHSGTALGDMLQLAGYTDIDIESYFADLTAIIHITWHPNSKVDQLMFYHASLEDYLHNKDRSTIYHVDEQTMATKLSVMSLSNFQDFDSLALAIHPLGRIQKPTDQLADSLLAASTRHLRGNASYKYGYYILPSLMGHIERLYWETDRDFFKIMLQCWSRFVHMNNIDNYNFKDQLSYMQHFTLNSPATLYYEQYWMTSTGHRRQETLTALATSTTTDSGTHTTILRASPTATEADEGSIHDPSYSNTTPHERPNSRSFTPSSSRNLDSYDSTSVPLLRSAPRPSHRSSALFHSNAASNRGVAPSVSRNALRDQYVRNNDDAGHDTRPSSREVNEATEIGAAETAERQRATVEPVRSPGVFSLLDSIKQKVMRRQHHGASRAINAIQEQGEGSGSKDHENITSQLRMIRVKIHYHDEIRGMTLTPETPFSEFVDVVTKKFGNFGGLTMKFKDEEGASITLRDDSDYKHAIETVRENSKGKGEGKLEIWCRDRGRHAIG